LKTTQKYWNPLDTENAQKWEDVDGSNGNLQQVTVAYDKESGDYTRLTKIKAGYSTEAYGAKSHDYPEEIFIVSGKLYDEAFDMWLEKGYYASRPPHEVHGPFVADKEDVIILEVSYPSQV